nr:MAG TPA: hypothetical protein [Caudoviricetes sp.]
MVHKLQCLAIIFKIKLIYFKYLIGWFIIL